MNGSSSFEIFPPNFLHKTMLGGPLHGPSYDFSCLILYMLTSAYSIRGRTRDLYSFLVNFVVDTFQNIKPLRSFLMNLLKDMGPLRKVVAKNNTYMGVLWDFDNFFITVK